MPQLAERLSFDLADALARDHELASNFFECSASPILEAKAEFKHLTLARREAIEDIHHLLFEQLMRCGVRGSKCCLVFQEVAEVALVIFADRRFYSTGIHG